MAIDADEPQDTSTQELKPSKKRLAVPWKVIALYILPALSVFIIFFIMHSYLVKPAPNRQQISEMINKKNENEVVPNNTNGEETKSVERIDEDLPQGSDIPFIGPQHYYHSFTGALATDLKNGSGILTIEVAVSIFMGKLNAEAYFENFRNFEPALRSAILALMRTKTKSQIETYEGKENLKLEILDLINKELVELGSKPEIKTVQLTKILLI